MAASAWFGVGQELRGITDVFMPVLCSVLGGMHDFNAFVSVEVCGVNFSRVRWSFSDSPIAGVVFIGKSECCVFLRNRAPDGLRLEARLCFR